MIAEGAYSRLSENFSGYGEGGFFTNLAGLQARLAFQIQTGVNPALSSPVEDVAAISPRPLLLIYGEGEAGAPLEALWQAARAPKERWIVPGGQHGCNHLAAPEEYPRRVVEFFNRALLP